MEWLDGNDKCSETTHVSVSKRIGLLGKLYALVCAAVLNSERTGSQLFGCRHVILIFPGLVPERCSCLCAALLNATLAARSGELNLDPDLRLYIHKRFSPGLRAAIRPIRPIALGYECERIMSSVRGNLERPSESHVHNRIGAKPNTLRGGICGRAHGERQAILQRRQQWRHLVRYGLPLSSDGSRASQLRDRPFMRYRLRYLAGPVSLNKALKALCASVRR